MLKVTITLDESKTKSINPHTGARLYRYVNNGKDALSTVHIISKFVDNTEKAMVFVEENQVTDFSIDSHSFKKPN